MPSKLQEMIGQVRQEQKLPGIIPERCVHSIIETASCKACVESCPQHAWRLDDEALGIDASACDGCGLCVPACPQGAIHMRLEIMVGDWRDPPIALCACEYAQSPGTEGVVTCIHAIGLQDVLRLYLRGVTEWVVFTADCDSCVRGQGMDFSERLDALNSSLQQSGHIGITLRRRSPTQWQQLYQQLSGFSAGPRLSRRGFLQGFLKTGLQQELELFDQPKDKQTPFVPPGQLLPDARSKTVWPCLPVIDGKLCNGCDACARLCPQHAIRLQETDNQSSYQLKPQACSGCGVCVDVCEQQAVTLDLWKVQVQQEILLTTVKCSSCGNPFHIPEDPAGNRHTLCRICAQKNHQGNLYQVLN